MKIARITLPNGMVADLKGDGVWESEVQPLKDLLNGLYSPAQYRPSPSSPRSDVGNQAVVASQALKAELEWLIPTETTETVY